jgi:hypothetical protein
MCNFINARRQELAFTDGRDVALEAIRKALHRGPTRPDALHKRAPAEYPAVADMLLTKVERKKRKRADAPHSFSNLATEAIRKIHAEGASPLDPEYLGKGEAVFLRDNRPSVQAIRKTHGNPYLPGAMRKAVVKPTPSRGSSNGVWDDTHANTGADNNFRNDAAPTNKPTVIAREVPRDVSHSPNIQAVLDALKQDFARGAKRMI